MAARETISTSTVECEFPAEGVALLTLNRPEFGNGVVPEMVRDFLEVLDAIETGSDIRAVVLTGAGKVFCAGADLYAMRDYLEKRLRVEEEPFNARALLPLTQRICASRLPFVAAVNGAATAGGFDLALACDLRIAADTAKLGETYVKLGLAPGNGGTYFLPRLVGTGLAAELALTGDMIDAKRALEIGVVNRVTTADELITTAVELAAKIARRPRHAIEATKQALRAAWSQDLATAMNSSYWVTTSLQYSADVHEGVVAAIEKRQPKYNN